MSGPTPDSKSEKKQLKKPFQSKVRRLPFFRPLADPCTGKLAWVNFVVCLLLIDPPSHTHLDRQIRPLDKRAHFGA